MQSTSFHVRLNIDVFEHPKNAFILESSVDDKSLRILLKEFIPKSIYAGQIVFRVNDEMNLLEGSLVDHVNTFMPGLSLESTLVVHFDMGTGHEAFCQT